MRGEAPARPSRLPQKTPRMVCNIQRSKGLNPIGLLGGWNGREKWSGRLEEVPCQLYSLRLAILKEKIWVEVETF